MARGIASLRLDLRSRPCPPGQGHGHERPGPRRRTRPCHARFRRGGERHHGCHLLGGGRRHPRLAMTRTAAQRAVRRPRQAPPSSHLQSRPRHRGLGVSRAMPKSRPQSRVPRDHALCSDEAMDLPLPFVIRESTHRIHDPLTRAKLARLGEALVGKHCRRSSEAFSGGRRSPMPETRNLPLSRRRSRPERLPRSSTPADLGSRCSRSQRARDEPICRAVAPRLGLACAR